jgi:hypothetical protein
MKKQLIPVLMVLVLMVNACRHKEETPPVCIAGTGGNVTIVVYADHLGMPLLNFYSHPDTAFIRFGITVSPGTKPGDFSTYFVSEPGEDHIHCPGLKCGDYFIYRTAWDSVAGITRYGGYGISFSDTSGDKMIHVAVN